MADTVFYASRFTEDWLVEKQASLFLNSKIFKIYYL